MNTKQRLTDDEIRELARREVSIARTPRHAAKKLGISREAMLGLASGARVRPATFAYIREHLATPDAISSVGLPKADR